MHEELSRPILGLTLSQTNSRTVQRRQLLSACALVYIVERAARRGRGRWWSGCLLRVCGLEYFVFCVSVIFWFQM